MSIVDEDQKTTECSGSFSSRTKLQSPVATQLKNLDSSGLKGAMTQGIEEALAEAIKMAFFAANTGVKHAFICFIEMG